MKNYKIIYFLLSFIFITGSVSIAVLKTKEYRFIKAGGGLRMRSEPTLKGKKIGLIPNFTKVILLEETGKKITISGATGRWSKVEWVDKTGWVFGGFLTGKKPLPRADLKKLRSYRGTIVIGGIEFAGIKGGCFMMGSNDRYSNEKPVHRVCVDSFWMGRYEVTQAQYEGITGENPSDFKGRSRPVEQVSWNDAIAFTEKFGSKYRVRARLPYEAEWEYAARAGTKTKYYWGDKMNGSYAWFSGNSGKETHPVGQKKPNRWGLYDMSGNVWEWCMDRYDKNYYSSSPLRNPKGPSSGDLIRVLRGGSWYDGVGDLRSAVRYYDWPDNRDESGGFRIVLSPPK